MPQHHRVWAACGFALALSASLVSAQNPKTAHEMYLYALKINECANERYGWGYMMNAARKDYPPAMYEWGKCYINREDEVERKTAFKYLKGALEKGHAEAAIEVGRAYAKGLGTSKNPQEAERLLRPAVEARNTRAMLILGNMYAGSPARVEEARALFRRAADAGDATGLYNLATTYPLTDPEHVRLMEAAAAKGAATPEEMAAVRENHKRALGLVSVREAAEKGDPKAQFQMGEYYRKGEAGLYVFFVNALAWYVRSANGGHVPAMNQCGWMYWKGFGTKISGAEALRWYLRSSDAGDASGANTAGVILADAHGVPRDVERARKLFQLATERGDVQAPYNLAHTYPEKSDERLYWFERAAEKGHADAKKFLADERKANAEWRAALDAAKRRMAEEARLAPYRKGMPAGWTDHFKPPVYFWTPAALQPDPKKGADVHFQLMAASGRTLIFFEELQIKAAPIQYIALMPQVCGQNRDCRAEGALPGIANSFVLTATLQSATTTQIYFTDGASVWRIRVIGNGDERTKILRQMLPSIRLMPR